MEKAIILDYDFLLRHVILEQVLIHTASYLVKWGYYSTVLIKLKGLNVKIHLRKCTGLYILV